MPDSDTPNVNTNEIFISWDKIHKDSKALALKLEPILQWTGIVAVTRGGMVPACLVARQLDLKLIETFCITSYSYQDQGQADIPKALTLEDGGKGWIIIDDMVDSGKTFQILQSHLPNATFACLYAKPDGKPSTHYYIDDFAQTDWLHCPWECDGDTGQPQGY